MKQQLAAAATILALASAGPAHAACGGGFDRWLATFKQEAVAGGISSRTIETALAGVRFEQSVVNRDRAQGVFSQTFLEFAGRMVAGYRLQQGAAELKKNAATFGRIEREFGVPGPVIVGFWGLETDFGANIGDFPTLNALATLAYDCRRPEKFRPQLLDALRIIEAGDLRADQMRGAWAGELGQLQFMPSDYFRSAVDYDGDGRRDIIDSVPDALASAGKFIKSLGWRAGEPWLQEVRVADTVPWREAARGIFRKRGFWAAAGVSRADGSPLPADAVPAALILPMGRLGPSFLAYENFPVFWEWNNSSNYILSAAYLATRLAGAPRMNRGSAPPILSTEEMREVQERLNAMGYDAGVPDGRLGELTRTGVKQAQLRFGLPADGYPTRELLELLRRR
jgi:lytic murein transglycosylase